MRKFETPAENQAPTSVRILDVAERLVQKRGYNGFSYADIAAELNITTASLHYHFPGKAELGKALIERYRERFNALLASIEERLSDAPARLAAYAEAYAAVLSEHRLCLCGILAAEYETLPEPMRKAIIRFFDENEAWLGRVLDDGRRQGSLRFDGPALAAARMIISGLEGAMLVARPYADLSRFRSTAAQILAGLVPEAPVPA